MRNSYPKKLGKKQDDETTEETGRQVYSKNVLFVKYGMKFFGIWPGDDRWLANVKFFVFGSIMMYLIVTSVISTFACNSFEMLMDYSIYTVVFACALSKLTILKLRKKNVFVILDTMEIDYERYEEFSQACRIIISSNLKKLKLITLFTPILSYFTFITYDIQLFENKASVLQVLKESPVVRVLPQAIHDSTLLVYLSCFGIYAIGVSLFITAIITVDSVYAMTTIHGINKFTIVSETLKNHDVRVAHRFDRSNYLRYCKCIGCLINEHADTLRYVRLVESTFHVLLLVEILQNLLHFGMEIEYFVWSFNIKSTLKLIHSSAMLLSMIGRLYLYCGAAKSLTEASKQVGESAFQMRWYDVECQQRKDLLTLMLMSTMPRYVTAGKLVNLSLETVIKILQASFSYASVILLTRERY